MRSPYTRQKALLTALLPMGLVTLLAIGWLVSSNNQARKQALTNEMRLTVARLDAELAAAGSDLKPAKAKALVLEAAERSGMELELVDREGVVLSGSGKPVASSSTGTGTVPVEFKRPAISAAELNLALRGGERLTKVIDPSTKKSLWRLTVPRSLAAADNNNAGHFLRATVEPAVFVNPVFFALSLLVAASIVMGMLTVWGIRLWDRLLLPVHQFIEAFGAIGSGNYQHPLSLASATGEWRKLHGSFDKMRGLLDQRERALRDDTEQMEAVLSSMTEGVLATDHAGIVTMANGAACDMLSIAKQSLLNRSLIEIVRIPEITAAIERTRETRKRTECEFKTRTEPRRIIQARLTIPADQEPPGVAIVLHDVTGLRQLETMRRDFVANVSHELKTPLASIRAYAETLRLGAINDSPRNIEFVEQIETQAGVLEQQIQDLIQLARVESGASTFEITAVEVNQICKECGQQFQNVAQNRSLLLVLDLERKPLKIRADAESIKTILTNLLSNAIHYTPAGGSVTLRSKSIHREGSVSQQFVQLEVIDTGIGIAREQQQRIFERFYRVDQARSREMGGTGLGLSIVKHLANAFEGTVELESKIGKGSRFCIRFPAAE